MQAGAPSPPPVDVEAQQGLGGGPQRGPGRGGGGGLGVRVVVVEVIWQAGKREEAGAGQKMASVRSIGSMLAGLPTNLLACALAKRLAQPKRVPPNKWLEGSWAAQS